MRKFWIGRVLLACLVVAIAATACSGASSDDRAFGTADTDRGTTGPRHTDGADPGSVERDTTSSPTTEPVRGPLGSGNAVTIAFAGDSSFQGLDSGLASDPRGLLTAIAPVLGDADLTMVNLEAALGTGGTPEAKTFTFRAPESALDALAAAGVDVVTMANNHGMDFGEGGLASSLEIRSRSDVHVLGIGKDETDALKPFIAEVGGQRIAFLAANDVFDSALQARWTATDSRAGIASAKGIHQQRLLDSVHDVAARADTVVVYLHYGRETETCPNDRQVELARSLLDAGAHIVVGSHAHRLQGVGYSGDGLIAYGLGNFIFRPGSAAGTETGVLVVTVTGSRVDGFEWRPAVIRNGVPVPLTGAPARAERDKMERLARCADLSGESPSSKAESSSSTVMEPADGRTEHRSAGTGRGSGRNETHG